MSFFKVTRLAGQVSFVTTAARFHTAVIFKDKKITTWFRTVLSDREH